MPVPQALAAVASRTSDEKFCHAGLMAQGFIVLAESDALQLLGGVIGPLLTMGAREDIR
jgi:hypothetical protein